MALDIWKKTIQGEKYTFLVSFNHENQFHNKKNFMKKPFHNLFCQQSSMGLCIGKCQNEQRLP